MSPKTARFNGHVDLHMQFVEVHVKAYLGNFSPRQRKKTAQIQADVIGKACELYHVRPTQDLRNAEYGQNTSFQGGHSGSAERHRYRQSSRSNRSRPTDGIMAEFLSRRPIGDAGGAVAFPSVVTAKLNAL
jgi:hypothetical protein